MKTFLKSIAAITLASSIGIATVPSFASDKNAELESKFKAADTNADGKLTKAEAEAGNMKRIAKNFDRIDADKDGSLTLDEIKARAGK